MSREETAPPRASAARAAPQLEHTRTRERGHGLSLEVHRFVDRGATPSGLTVLLVHGFMDAGGTWDDVAAVLAGAGHEVVAPDMRGFGASDRVGPGGYYHFPDYVADLDVLVEQLAPARLAVVGHSMGGTISCLFTGSHPERVERLALLEGLGALDLGPDVAVERMKGWLADLRKGERRNRSLSSLDDAASRLALSHPNVPRAALVSRAERLVARAADGELRWAFDPLHRTRSPTPFSLASFRRFLESIRCPTVFVSGGETGWHPPDEEQRLGWIAGARRLELPGAGHMMHWTAPAELGAMLVRFLGGDG